MPRRADAYRGLAQASRLRVMSLVLDRPGIDLAELSDATGLHVNTVRDHLRVLEDSGFVHGRPLRSGTRGRPRTAYFPVREVVANPVAARRIEDAKRRGDLLRRVTGAPAPAGLDEDAVHQIDALYQHLDDVGLEPDLDEEALRVELIPCPFHDLVESNPEVACRVHEELIRTVLDQAGGPVRLIELQPFRTPHACRAHLGVSASDETRSSSLIR